MDIQSSRVGNWRRIVMVAAGLAIIVVGTLGLAFAQRVPIRHFTQADITAITSELRRADESIYLIRTPVFRDGRIVGSQLHGTLPMREVEQLAESLNVRLDRDGNVLAVFDPNDGDATGGNDCGGSMCGAQGGGGGGGGSGGAKGGGDVNEPGSMYPANGRDLSQRLDTLLVDIEVSSYQFLR